MLYKKLGIKDIELYNKDILIPGWHFQGPIELQAIISIKILSFKIFFQQTYLLCIISCSEADFYHFFKTIALLSCLSFHLSHFYFAYRYYNCLHQILNKTVYDNYLN